VTDGYQRWLKPGLDGLAGGVLLLLALPLMGLVALVVWVNMGQPVIIRQRRVGHGGGIFSMYKFRTMEPDRRQRRQDFSGPERRLNHKSPEDPRMTRVGRVLRTWSLDELPQLWNVVRGEMSLVGPRPELEEVVERHYQPWQHRRHQVKPGLTGLWQISERNNGPMHEHTEVDLAYLEQISLRTDLEILLRTVPAALGYRRGF
jgi:lipopolysaccharide/colanic/teichoic acid biosynthesis glycosyltransferase